MRPPASRTSNASTVLDDLDALDVAVGTTAARVRRSGSGRRGPLVALERVRLALVPTAVVVLVLGPIRAAIAVGVLLLRIGLRLRVEVLAELAGRGRDNGARRIGEPFRQPALETVREPIAIAVELTWAGLRNVHLAPVRETVVVRVSVEPLRAPRRLGGVGQPVAIGVSRRRVHVGRPPVGGRAARDEQAAVERRAVGRDL